MRLLQYRYILILYYIFCAICFTSYGTELSVSQLAKGVNQVRMLIKSGELRMLVSIHEEAIDSPEEIRRWLKAQIADLRHRYPPILTPISQQHFDKDVRALQYLAEEHSGRDEIFEANVAFQIDEDRFEAFPQHYRYRSILTDRRKDIDAYSEKGKFFHVGKQTVFVYDGENLIEEVESRFIPLEVNLSLKPKYYGFFHPELFASPIHEVPVGKVKLLRQEEIDSIPCYVLEFPVEIGFYRCWVAPKLGFSLLRQDECYLSGKVRASFTYKNFQQLSNGKWFPMQVQVTFYSPNGKVSRVEQITVKDLLIDIPFPEDYFSIDLANLKDHLIKIDARILSGQVPNGQPNKKGNVDESRLKCGPLCLLKVCQIYGIESTLVELEKLSKFHPTGGTSMRGLYEAAQKKELNPKGMHLDFKQLTERRMPAILHVHDTHFIVVKSIDGQNVNIYDPVRGDDKLSRKRLEEIWSGNALLFNPGKHDKTEKKPLVDVGFVDASVQAYFETTEHDFGLIDAGTEVEHTFVLENRGTTPLKILDIKHTCSCTIGQSTSEPIAPGKKTEIKVKMSTSPQENGRLNKIVTVYTSDPKKQRINLKLLATIRQPIIVLPSHISFGRFQKQHLPSKKLEIRIPDPEQVKMLKIYSLSGNLKLKITEEGQEHQTCEVSVVPNMSPGRFKGALLIDYTLHGKKGRMEVPFDGELLGDIEARPDRVFFGIVRKHQTSTRKVRLSKLVESDIHISSVNSNTDDLSVSLNTIKEGAEYELIISVGPNSSIGEHSAKIEVITSSSKQPLIKIPAYWIVSAN